LEQRRVAEHDVRGDTPLGGELPPERLEALEQLCFYARCAEVSLPSDLAARTSVRTPPPVIRRRLCDGIVSGASIARHSAGLEIFTEVADQSLMSASFGLGELEHLAS